jgi:oligopeptidase A
VYRREGKQDHIASFYLDPFSRPKEKNGGAWMNVCVDRSKLFGSKDSNGVRVPVAYLICNQSPPVGGKPSLMTFREVETLFHEFGHGLQHMLTTVDHGAVAGINGIEWDAVEIPSQAMELASCACAKLTRANSVTLQSISGHYETGAPLPVALFEKIKAARNYMVATQMLRQLGFGALDMHLHHGYDGKEPLFDVQKRMLQRSVHGDVHPVRCVSN